MSATPALRISPSKFFDISGLLFWEVGIKYSLAPGVSADSFFEDFDERFSPVTGLTRAPGTELSTTKSQVISVKDSGMTRWTPRSSPPPPLPLPAKRSRPVPRPRRAPRLSARRAYSKPSPPPMSPVPPYPTPGSRYAISVPFLLNIGQERPPGPDLDIVGVSAEGEDPADRLKEGER